jgi:hypothetical protein
MRFIPRTNRFRALLLFGLMACSQRNAAGLEFEVTLAPHAATKPITGRLFVFLSKVGQFTDRQRPEPRFGPSWFRPEPFFGLDIRDFAPGATRRIGAQAAGFPEPLDKLPAGKYRVQAVLDQSDWEEPGSGPGNPFSRVVEATLDGQSPTTVRLTMDHVVKEPPFPELTWMREVVVESKLLSKFHGRPVIERATVILPDGYAQEPRRRYPVIYMVPGFGGSHRDALKQYASAPTTTESEEGEVDFIRVMLSGNCRWGDHVYADSATNGPRGQALIDEVIPAIDRTFRTLPAREARFVNGHSSGGWSSLWLQISYPDTFGGVWSTAPDPVDFRDFQNIDLYADPPQSMYIDPQGARRPIARRGGRVVQWYDTFARMDDVLESGGQLRSFEAVFSPLDAEGLPQRLWDRRTGRIDPRVADAWRKYDIRLKLQREWPTSGAKLRGRLRVIVGSLDTFYLEGAVEKLAVTLKRLDPTSVVTIVPDKDHSTLITSEFNQSIRREMAEEFLKHQPEAARQEQAVGSR